MFYESKYALAFEHYVASNPEKYVHWTGWKRQYWPADIVKSGLKFYAFDKRSRSLFALLQVTQCKVFSYRTKTEFRKIVRKSINAETLGEKHFERVPISSGDEKDCIGIALRWKVVKRVNIPLGGNFHQIGWRELQNDYVSSRYLVASDVKPPRRIETKTSRVVRDTAKARQLKVRYKHRCQVCGTKIVLGGGQVYSEVHHIRPLGGHGGLDIEGNMLVLCPNHHAQFDFGVPYFVSDHEVKISKRILNLQSHHKLDPANIEYHNRKLYVQE